MKIDHVKALEAERAAHAETKRERDEALKALDRLGTFEAFTTEGWGFSHPEITARVDYARRVREGGKVDG